MKRLLATRSNFSERGPLVQEMIPFLRKSIPTLQLTAREEAANWYAVSAGILTQENIYIYLLYNKQYDVIEISRIVEYWRKEHGTNE
jgi:hypothetical protein